MAAQSGSNGNRSGSTQAQKASTNGTGGHRGFQSVSARCRQPKAACWSETLRLLSNIAPRSHATRTTSRLNTAERCWWSRKSAPALINTSGVPRLLYALSGYCEPARRAGAAPTRSPQRGPFLHRMHHHTNWHVADTSSVTNANVENDTCAWSGGGRVYLNYCCGGTSKILTFERCPRRTTRRRAACFSAGRRRDGAPGCFAAACRSACLRAPPRPESSSRRRAAWPCGASACAATCCHRAGALLLTTFLSRSADRMRAARCTARTAAAADDARS